MRRLADLVDFVDIDDSALGGLEIEVGGVQQLEQDILDVLADVAGLGQGRRVADGKGHIQDTGERTGQKGLSTPRRSDQEDIRFVELDLGLGVLPVHEPLVVVMHGHRKHLLGALLADDIGVELFLDFPRRGNVGEEGLGNAPAAPLLIEDRLTQLDTVAADVNIPRPLDQRAHVAVALAAERTVGVLFRARWVSRADAATSVSFSAAATRRTTARDVLTRWHARSFLRFRDALVGPRLHRSFSRKMPRVS